MPVSYTHLDVYKRQIYYRSGRSILVAVLFHLAANLGNEALRTHPDTTAIQVALLVFLTVIVVWWDRDLFFGLSLIHL